jgi:hypothetical protein
MGSHKAQQGVTYLGFPQPLLPSDPPPTSFRSPSAPLNTSPKHAASLSKQILAPAPCLSLMVIMRPVTFSFGAMPRSASCGC